MPEPELPVTGLRWSTERVWLLRAWEVIRRVAMGTYQDGFIHAGNLAYLALIALFPFFITATALMSAIGRSEEGLHALEVILATMPKGVAATLEAPVREVLSARNGALLWVGAAIGLWTVGSLIETVRDILQRAYGTSGGQSFFARRLYSIGLIIGSVVLLMVSFSLQIVTVAAEDLMARFLPPDIVGLGELALTRFISIIGLFLSIYVLFLSLTPSAFRGRHHPKWPGALLTTGWWVAVTLALPPILARMLAYDLTYGSLAGVMVSLFFFYLIGLGMVIGAELNAALAGATATGPNRIGMVQKQHRDRKNNGDVHEEQQ